jgi:hypothetical protein
VHSKLLHFHLEGFNVHRKYSYICRRSVEQHIDKETLPEFVILCVLIERFLPYCINLKTTARV